MKVWITLSSVLLLVLALPQLGWQYYTTLMLSFFADATALLGLNLLFGYTGLLSFGHALFLGLGAYTTAWLTSVWGIRSMEVILLTAMVVAVLVAAPIGALCARYVKIYFGMLTLAFSMLFYSFLLKFYHLTVGDEGMRVLRPFLLGCDLSGMPKISFLIGPYYFDCLPQEVRSVVYTNAMGPRGDAVAKDRSGQAHCAASASGVRPPSATSCRTETPRARSPRCPGASAGA